MHLWLTRTGIVAMAICCCTSLRAPIATAAEQAAPEFSFEKAKKVLLKFLKKTDGKDVFIIGYRPVSGSEVDLYYLVDDIYVGPMKVLLLTTDSGRRWYLMANSPLPVK